MSVIFDTHGPDVDRFEVVVILFPTERRQYKDKNT